jgi:LysM repeat protein
MAERNLLDAFNDCINRLAAGQSIDDCLHAYPQYAARLRPMLETGVLVKRAQASSLEVMAAQDRVRFQISQAVAARPPSHHEQPFRRLLTLAAGLAFVLLIGLSSGALAQNSLPGDLLYSFKLTTESLMLSLSGSDAAIQDRFEQRRIDETARLLELMRTETVTFEGQLQALEGSIWQVANLSVNVESDTPGSAEVNIGDQIRVEGFTTPQGELFASQITLIEENSDEALPTSTSMPTIAPSFTPTSEPSLTPTLSATPTDTPTPTQTRTTTPTHTPSPTLTPDSLPTATTCVPSKPDDWVSYQIQTGDTLSGLAARTGSSLEELLAVNCLSDARLIIVGQEIFLPRIPTSVISPTLPPTTNDNSSENPPPSNGGQSNDNNNSNDNSDDSSNDNNNNNEDNSGHGSDDNGNDNS